MHRHDYRIAAAVFPGPGGRLRRRFPAGRGHRGRGRRAARGTPEQGQEDQRQVQEGRPGEGRPGILRNQVPHILVKCVIFCIFNDCYEGH